MLPLADLRPWEQNYRHHPAEQLDRIRESLRRNGQRKAVVVQASTMRIIAGHGVAEAMRLEGYTEARCDVWDCSDEQAAAYLVDDNELSRHAVDDEAALAALLLELQDTQYAPVSFNEAEIEELLTQAATPGPFPEAAEPEEPPVDPVTKPGDVWLCGKHRVVCWDCTDAAVWDAVTQGRKARMVWTDPPYGVNHAGGTKDPRSEQYRSGDTLENDNLSEADTETLCRDALAQAFANTEPGAAAYVACPAGTLLPHFIAAFNASGFGFRHSLAWVKQQFVFGRCDYHYRHETILYGWKPDGAHYFVDDHTKTSVFEVDKPHRSEEHPTMKPVELVAEMVANSSKPGDIVADPFLGSGTTLMAAEQLGRVCYGIEIEPRYVDVAVRRWMKTTGNVATLEATGEAFPVVNTL